MRLIGIKTGEGDPRIMKNLQPNSWYPFGDYIEPIEENGLCKQGRSRGHLWRYFGH